MANRHLSDYIKQAWPILEPAVDYMHNWHIDAISEHLEAVTSGQIKRLIINMPPRYMKSIAVSVMWPSWVWCKLPTSRWIFASYSSSLSTKHSIDRRTIMQSPWYQERWGDQFRLSADQNIKTEYTNNRRGHMIATSVGGTATGKGGDFVIVDDPVNPKAAQSDTLRNEANTFFDQTLTTRLDNKKKGCIVIVMQRLHELDLTGHVMKKQKEELEEYDVYKYEQLCLPAEPATQMVVNFPISKKELIRNPGDLLWPEREGVPELKAQKRNLGSYGYAGQYDQDPSPAEGGIIKRTWFNRYKEAPALSTFSQILISVDCAFKDKIDSDWVVMQVWGRQMARKYLLHQVKAKMDFPTTLRVFKQLCESWPQARTKIVEDKANGSALIQTIKDTIPGVIAVDPQGGKVARVHAVSPTLEAGDVFIPDDSVCDWVGDFVEECAKFPNAANDDQVDAMSQALLRIGEDDFMPWSTHVDWL